MATNKGKGIMANLKKETQPFIEQAANSVIPGMGDALQGVDSLLGAVGLHDSPSIFSKDAFNLSTTNRSLCVTRLGMRTDEVCEDHSQVISQKPLSGDFNELTKVKYRFDTIKWSTSQPATTQLAVYPVTPLISGPQYNYTIDYWTLDLQDFKKETKPCMESSFLSFFAANRTYWKGSITYTIEVIHAKFQQAQGMIVFDPNPYSDKPITFDEAKNLKPVTFDTSKDSSVEYTVPYVYTADYCIINHDQLPNRNFTKPQKRGIGNLYIFVMNALTRGSTTVSDSVNINVYIHSNDMDFKVPRTVFYDRYEPVSYVETLPTVPEVVDFYTNKTKPPIVDIPMVDEIGIQEAPHLETVETEDKGEFPTGDSPDAVTQPLTEVSALDGVAEDETENLTGRKVTKNIAHVTNVKTVDSATVYERQYVFAEGIALNTSMPARRLFFERDAPVSLFKNPQLQTFLSKFFAFYRADLQFTIKAQPTPMQQGQVLIYAVPKSLGSTITDASLLGLPHTMYNLSNSTERSFVASYSQETRVSSLITDKNLYSLKMMVWNPLQTGVGGPTSLEFAIYLKLLNIQVTIPRAVSSSTMVVNLLKELRSQMTQHEKVQVARAAMGHDEIDIPMVDEMEAEQPVANVEGGVVSQAVYNIKPPIQDNFKMGAHKNIYDQLRIPRLLGVVDYKPINPSTLLPNVHVTLAYNQMAWAQCAAYWSGSIRLYFISPRGTVDSNSVEIQWIPEWHPNVRNNRGIGFNASDIGTFGYRSAFQGGFTQIWNMNVQQAIILEIPFYSATPIKSTRDLSLGWLRTMVIGDTTEKINFQIFTAIGEDFLLYQIATPPPMVRLNPKTDEEYEDCGQSNFDQLKLCGDVESNPGPPIHSKYMKGEQPQTAAMKSFVRSCAQCIRNMSPDIRMVHITLSNGDDEDEEEPDDPKDDSGVTTIVKTIFKFVAATSLITIPLLIGYMSSDIGKDHTLFTRFTDWMGANKLSKWYSKWWLGQKITNAFKIFYRVIKVISQVMMVLWVSSRLVMLFQKERKYSLTEFLMDVAVAAPSLYELSFAAFDRLNECNIFKWKTSMVGSYGYTSLKNYILPIFMAMGASIFGTSSKYGFGLPLEYVRWMLTGALTKAFQGMFVDKIKTLATELINLVCFGDDGGMMSKEAEDCYNSNAHKISSLMTDYHYRVNKNGFSNANLKRRDGDPKGQYHDLSNGDFAKRCALETASMVKYLVWLKKNERTVAQFIERVATLGRDIQKVADFTSGRAEPIGVAFKGAPGIGKSLLAATLLPGDIGKELGFIEKKDRISEFVYSAPTGKDQKFYDAYIGQGWFYIDDFGTDAEGKGYMELINMISPSSCILNMADLKDKGICLTSPFVVISTNKPTLTGMDNVITNTSALCRRFEDHFYEIRINDEFVKAGGEVRLDFMKLKDEMTTLKDNGGDKRAFLDLMNRVWTIARCSPENGRGIENFNYEEVVNRITTTYREKTKGNDDLLEAVNFLSDGVSMADELTPEEAEMVFSPPEIVEEPDAPPEMPEIFTEEECPTVPELPLEPVPPTIDCLPRESGPGLAKDKDWDIRGKVRRGLGNDPEMKEYEEIRSVFYAELNGNVKKVDVYGSGNCLFFYKWSGKTVPFDKSKDELVRALWKHPFFAAEVAMYIRYFFSKPKVETHKDIVIDVIQKLPVKKNWSQLIIWNAVLKYEIKVPEVNPTTNPIVATCIEPVVHRPKCDNVDKNMKDYKLTEGKYVNFYTSPYCKEENYHEYLSHAIKCKDTTTARGVAIAIACNIMDDIDPDWYSPDLIIKAGQFYIRKFQPPDLYDKEETVAKLLKVSEMDDAEKRTLAHSLVLHFEKVRNGPDTTIFGLFEGETVFFSPECPVDFNHFPKEFVERYQKQSHKTHSDHYLINNKGLVYSIFSNVVAGAALAFVVYWIYRLVKKVIAYFVKTWRNLDRCEEEEQERKSQEEHDSVVIQMVYGKGKKNMRKPLNAKITEDPTTTPMVDQTHSKFDNNTRTLVIKNLTTGRQFIGQVSFINDNTFLVNYHTVENAGTNYDAVILENCGNVMRQTEVSFNKSVRLEHEGRATDVVVVRTRRFQNIRKLPVISEAQLADIQEYSTELVVSKNPTPKKTHKNKGRMFTRTDLDKHRKNENIICKGSYDCSYGDSGSAVVTNIGNKTVLVGIFHGKRGSEDSDKYIVNAVYFKTLEGALSSLKGGIALDSIYPEDAEELGGHNITITTESVFEDKSFEMCGRLEKAPFVNTNNTIIPTRVSDQTLHPDNSKPVEMSKKLLVKRAQKYGCGGNMPKDPDGEALDWAVSYLKTAMMSVLIDEHRDTLNDQEILNGTERGLMPLDMNTSVGFWKVNGITRKSVLEKVDDEIQWKDIPDSEEFYHPIWNVRIDKMTDWLSNHYDSGTRPVLLWNSTLKDERKETSKAHKPRVFEIPDFSSLLVQRKYHGAFINFWQSNGGFGLMHGIGLDPAPHSVVWYREFSRFQRKGEPVCLHADYREWDASFLPRYFDAILELEDFFYGKKDRAGRAASIQEIYHAGHAISDIYAKSNKGMKSGSLGTACFNSIAGAINILMAFYHLFRKKNRSRPKFKDFRKWVSVLVYGDDFLITIDKKISKWFNLRLVKAYLSQFGWKITRADKNEGEVDEYCVLEESTFLKRIWKKVDGEYRLVLPKNVIYGVLNWCHKKNYDLISVRVQQVEQALEMMSWHGEEDYNEFAMNVRFLVESRDPDLWAAGLCVHSYRYWESVNDTKIEEACFQTIRPTYMYRVDDPSYTAGCVLWISKIKAKKAGFDLKSQSKEIDEYSQVVKRQYNNCATENPANVHYI